MHTMEITYNGVELTVEYEYEPEEPETRDEPGCSASADIHAVICGEQDIYELISDKAASGIAEMIVENHDDDTQAGHVDYLIKQYKESLND